MKINNKTLVTYDNVLAYYANKKLPQKISYAITKNMIFVSNQLEPYRKELNKIIESYKKYYVKDENGKPIDMEIGVPKVDDTHEDDYISEINELLDMEIEIDDFYNIKDDAFDYIDSDRYDALTASDIINLQSILCNNDNLQNG